MKFFHAHLRLMLLGLTLSAGTATGRIPHIMTSKISLPIAKQTIISIKAIDDEQIECITTYEQRHVTHVLKIGNFDNDGITSINRVNDIQPLAPTLPQKPYAKHPTSLMAVKRFAKHALACIDSKDHSFATLINFHTKLQIIWVGFSPSGNYLFVVDKAGNVSRLDSKKMLRSYKKAMSRSKEIRRLAGLAHKALLGNMSTAKDLTQGVLNAAPDVLSGGVKKLKKIFKRL